MGSDCSLWTAVNTELPIQDQYGGLLKNDYLDIHGLNWSSSIFHGIKQKNK